MEKRVLSQLSAAPNLQVLHGKCFRSFDSQHCSIQHVFDSVLFSFQQQRRLDLLTITNFGKSSQTSAHSAPLVAICESGTDCSKLESLADSSDNTSAC